MTSTLVELEFVQQSLDFQDEYDKTKMHLFGLSETQFSLDELTAKAGLSTDDTLNEKKPKGNVQNPLLKTKNGFNPAITARRTGMNIAKGIEPETDLNQEHPIAI